MYLIVASFLCMLYVRTGSRCVRGSISCICVCFLGISFHRGAFAALSCDQPLDPKHLRCDCIFGFWSSMSQSFWVAINVQICGSTCLDYLSLGSPVAFNIRQAPRQVLQQKARGRLLSICDQSVDIAYMVVIVSILFVLQHLFRYACIFDFCAELSLLLPIVGFKIRQVSGRFFNKRETNDSCQPFRSVSMHYSR